MGIPERMQALIYSVMQRRTACAPSARAPSGPGGANGAGLVMDVVFGERLMALAALGFSGGYSEYREFRERERAWSPEQVSRLPVHELPKFSGCLL